MTLLLNYVNLEMRIFIPETGEVRKFFNGKLEISEVDPAYATVMAEAQRNPSITIVVNETSTPVVAKTSAPNACDACVPAQVFDTEEGLREHMNLVHLAKPVLSAEGEVIDGAASPPGKQRRPGQVEPIPAAKAGRGSR
jgi:hypothetical protein